MHRAGIIHEFRPCGDDRHCGIVDCPRIVIHKNPNLRRADARETARLSEGEIRVVCRVTVAAVQPGAVNRTVSAPNTPQAPAPPAHPPAPPKAADDPNLLARLV